MPRNTADSLTPLVLDWLRRYGLGVLVLVAVFTLCVLSVLRPPVDKPSARAFGFDDDWECSGNRGQMCWKKSWAGTKTEPSFEPSPSSK